MRRDITESILCTPDLDGELKKLDNMMRSYDGRMFHKEYNCKDKNKKRKRKNYKKKGR